MAHLIAGLFVDSKKAGNAVAELKEAGFADHISVIAKEWEGTEVKSHDVKQEFTPGGGTAIGAVVGGLAGLLVGAGSVFIPGVGALLVAGPFTVLMGGAGALTGGLIGFLVDAGVPENKAREYEEAVKQGQVLVAVTTEHENETLVRDILDRHQVVETDTRHQTVDTKM